VHVGHSTRAEHTYSASNKVTVLPKFTHAEHSVGKCLKAKQLSNCLILIAPNGAVGEYRAYDTLTNFYIRYHENTRENRRIK
jgi:hypothetical protein